MRKLYLLVISISLLSFSCTKNNSSTLNPGETTSPKVADIATKEVSLISASSTVDGIFSDYFQIVNDDYNYEISKPESSISLPTFKMPIKLKITGDYNYDAESTRANQYKFIFYFIDEEGNAIDDLTINTDFEVVKYYLVQGIDFKELLTSEVGKEFSYSFYTYVERENVEKMEKARSFKMEVIENTPSARFESVLNSLNKPTEISKFELKNGNTAIITYSQQEHDNYWDYGKQIEKTMVGTPARMIMKLDFIDQVELILPFNDKIYFSKITKEQIENYTGLSFDEIRSDWNTSFADVYIYQLNNPKREDYFKKFVAVQ